MHVGICRIFYSYITLFMTSLKTKNALTKIFNIKFQRIHMVKPIGINKLQITNSFLQMERPVQLKLVGKQLMPSRHVVSFLSQRYGYNGVIIPRVIGVRLL